MLIVFFRQKFGDFLFVQHFVQHFFSSAKTAEVTRLLPAALFSVDICTTDVNCIDTGYHLPNLVRVAGYEELVGLFRLNINGEILEKNNSEYIR